MPNGCRRCTRRQSRTRTSSPSGSSRTPTAPRKAMRTKADGSPASAATINTQVAAVKALLGFAHKVGFTRFNAAPLIKLKKAPRQLAQRILSEVDVQLLIREARPGRNRLMFEVAYFGGLRVSEIASLTWAPGNPPRDGRGTTRPRRQGR